MGRLLFEWCNRCARSAVVPAGGGAARQWALALAWCLLLVSPPSAASAATVSVGPSPDRYFVGDVVHYVAAVGERNALTVGREVRENQEAVWTLRDTGAIVIPGESCSSVDTHTVQCRSRPIPDLPQSFQPLSYAVVVLGDLDDELLSDGYIGTASGGPGNDRFSGGGRLFGDAGDDELLGWSHVDHLDGGTGNDRLVGADGNDELLGGGGTDRLLGEGGDDSLTDGDRDGAASAGAPGPDVLEAGPGSDTVSYRQRRAAISVDLADAAPDGAPGESDLLSGVESLIGGRGDDRLAGTDGSNTLVGRAGSDRLIARGGADRLDPGTGGGRISCGRGHDGILGATSHDLLHADCEAIRFSENDPPVISAYPRSFEADRVRFRVGCPPDELDGEEIGQTLCGGTIRIRQAAPGSQLLAIGRFRRDHWYRSLIDVRMTALGRRLASRPRGVRATVKLVMHVTSDGDAQGGRSALQWTIRLRNPR